MRQGRQEGRDHRRGAIGVELGIHLNGLGHECTIVEMTEHIAAKAQLTERTDYLTGWKKAA